MKKLLISQSNKSKNNAENLYPNFQSFFNISEDNEIFDENINIAKHYNESGKNIDFHLEECDAIYNKIFPDLLKEFNNLHNTNYSVKSGHLIFGFWLQRFIRILYDRFNQLKFIFDNHNIDKVKILNTENFNLSSNTSTEIIHLSSDNNWNYAIMSKIIKYFDLNKTIYEDDNFRKLKKNNSTSLNNYKKRNLKSILKDVLKIFNFLNFSESSVICETYLPFFLEKKLQIKLNKVPQMWDFDFKITKKFDNQIREKLYLNRNIDKYENKLENFIRKNIPMCLPVSFIEAFSELSKVSKKYPKRPKLIISATKFDSNDLFKIYSANNLELGSKIITGQHGNGSFLLPESKYSPENKFCDFYYTWGTNKNKNQIPLFNLNALNVKNSKNAAKKLLIFTTSYGFNQLIYDKQGLNFHNINLIQELIKTLPKNIKSSLVLKKHNASSLNCHRFLDSRYNLLKIKMLKNVSFSKSLESAKLSLFLYNSTGVLDCMALNKPVIFYLKDPLNTYSKEYEKKLKLLKDAKIFFNDFKSLKKHILEIWDNIDDWWENKFTQEKIKNFNKNFNEKYSKNKFSDFYRFLKNLDHNSQLNKDELYPLW